MHIKLYDVEEKKAKGVKKYVIKNYMKFDNYMDILNAFMLQSFNC